MSLRSIYLDSGRLTPTALLCFHLTLIPSSNARVHVASLLKTCLPTCEVESVMKGVGMEYWNYRVP